MRPLSIYLAALLALPLPSLASPQICGSFKKANAELTESGFSPTFAGETPNNVRYVIFSNEKTGAWAAFAVRDDASCLLVEGVGYLSTTPKEPSK